MLQATSSLSIGIQAKRETAIVLFNNSDAGTLVVEYFYWLVYEVLMHF